VVVAKETTMWYLIHQQAQAIIAEREREAARIRLERVVAAGQPVLVDETVAEAIRRHAARATLWVARTAYRLARAIDAEAVLD
jgi:hypothetical protein